MGRLKFRVLLFTPIRVPFDLFESKETHNNLKMYVHRDFIMDDCGVLLPGWLRTVRGVRLGRSSAQHLAEKSIQQPEIIRVFHESMLESALR